MTSAMKKSILLVASEPIYPARTNGLSIRYAPIIEALADEVDIDVVAILRSGIPFNGITALNNFCRSVHSYERQPQPVSLIKRTLVRISKCFLIGTPHIQYCHDEPKIKEFLQKISEQHHYDRVIWVTSAYLDIGIDIFGQDIILDSIDSVYNQFSRRQSRSVFDYLDRMHLRFWEKKIIKKTKATIFVSSADAGLYSDPKLKNKVHIIPNGAYLTDYTSSKSLESVTSSDPIRLGFLGNMGYQPNIDATIRLKRIYDMAIRRRPDLALLIIGRTPTQEILSLATDTVTITGTVDDIWPYVSTVDIFVFPMVSGGGQQNKMLEAMVAEKPVIANALANSGVEATSGEHLLVCDSDEDFVDAIILLADNPELRRRLGSSGRDFVQKTYNWNAILPKLRTLWLS